MKTFIKLMAATLLLSIVVKLQAQPALDPSFATTGYKLTKVDSLSVDVGQSVQVQTNGRILTAGNSFGIDQSLVVTRVRPNGKYDNTFGTGGIVILPGRSVSDMALTSNGKIIVAGGGVGPTNVSNFTITRLNKNGSLDSSFGIDGSASVNIPYKNMICNDVAIQDDGKIVLSGYQGYSGGLGDLIVARLNRNGTIDNSFATAGIFTLLLTNKHSACNQVVIQPDGKIVAGGYIDTLVLFFSVLHYDLAAIRFNINGTLDNTFGSNGIVRVDNGGEESSNATTLLSDGRIVLGGGSNGQFTALCLRPDGSKDMSFGTNGWKYISIYGGNAGCIAMLAEPDDDIIMAGQASSFTSEGSIKSVALVKMNSSGVLDTTYGSGGIDTLFNSLNLLACRDIAQQSDGKILVTGFWYADGLYCSIYTARFSNSATILKELSLKEAKQKLLLYPDPVTGNTFTIKYELVQSSNVMVTVYDINGRMMFTNNNGAAEAGTFAQIVTLPVNISGGMYYVVLNLDGVLTTQKIMVVR